MKGIKIDLSECMIDGLQAKHDVKIDETNNDAFVSR